MASTSKKLDRFEKFRTLLTGKESNEKQLLGGIMIVAHFCSAH